MPARSRLDKQQGTGAQWLHAKGRPLGFLLALQLMVPLALVAWPGVVRARSWLQWTLHLAALAVVTAALLLAGVWTVLPWWLPWLFLAVGMAVLVWRRPIPGSTGVTRTIALAAVIGGGSWMVASAVEGRRMPPGPVVDLAWPLPPGDYLVINGGRGLAVSAHAETLDLSVPRHRLFQGQSYGIDIVALGLTGRTTSGIWPSDPARYHIYGRLLRAPCSGRVIAQSDGEPDQKVPDLGADARTGNSVLLRCGVVDVLLAHMSPGSVAVRTGQPIRVGQLLGRAGNSGASNEPHLHIHAQGPGTPESPLSGEPLPIRFDGRWLVRNDRVAFTG